MITFLVKKLWFQKEAILSTQKKFIILDQGWGTFSGVEAKLKFATCNEAAVNNCDHFLH